MHITALQYGIRDLFNNLNFLKSIAYFVSIAESGYL